MRGTMLWFNVDKGHGYIRTEEDERLYVARSGFRADHEPQPRCKGRVVTFERQDDAEEAYAVDVEFVADDDPRRARLRHARGGRSL
jgi:cold shock CspA family protein